jgi:hypothetical protein
VIRETHKADLKRIIEKEYGALAGAANIQYYQPALNLLIGRLSAEDMVHAEETAMEWNNQGSPEDAKVR